MVQLVLNGQLQHIIDDILQARQVCLYWCTLFFSGTLFATCQHQMSDAFSSFSHWQWHCR